MIEDLGRGPLSAHAAVALVFNDAPARARLQQHLARLSPPEQLTVAEVGAWAGHPVLVLSLNQPAAGRFDLDAPAPDAPAPDTPAPDAPAPDAPAASRIDVAPTPLLKTLARVPGDSVLPRLTLRASRAGAAVVHTLAPAGVDPLTDPAALWRADATPGLRARDADHEARVLCRRRWREGLDEALQTVAQKPPAERGPTLSLLLNRLEQASADCLPLLDDAERGLLSLVSTLPSLMAGVTPPALAAALAQGCEQGAVSLCWLHDRLPVEATPVAALAQVDGAAGRPEVLGAHPVWLTLRDDALRLDDAPVCPDGWRDAADAPAPCLIEALTARAAAAPDARLLLDLPAAAPLGALETLSRAAARAPLASRVFIRARDARGLPTALPLGVAALDPATPAPDAAPSQIACGLAQQGYDPLGRRVSDPTEIDEAPAEADEAPRCALAVLLGADRSVSVHHVSAEAVYDLGALPAEAGAWPLDAVEAWLAGYLLVSEREGGDPVMALTRPVDPSATHTGFSTHRRACPLTLRVADDAALTWGDAAPLVGRLLNPRGAEDRPRLSLSALLPPGVATSAPQPPPPGLDPLTHLTSPVP